LLHPATRPESFVPGSANKIAKVPTLEARPKGWIFGSGIFLVALVAFLTYAPARNGYFLADDFVALNQLALKQTSFVDNLAWFGRDWGIGANFYRPIVRLGYYFQYLFFQDNPAGWHLVSVGLHSCNALLVFGLGYLLSKRIAVGVVAGLVFGLLPIHSEPVAWISGQTDLWATLFGLTATLCFIIMRQNQARGTRHTGWRVAALMGFALALGSKETAAALPSALLAYEFMTGGINRLRTKASPGHHSITTLWLNHAPFWIMLGLYIILRLLLFKGLGGYVTTVGQQPDLILWGRSNLRWLLLPFSVGGTDGLTFIIIVGAFVVLTAVQEWESGGRAGAFNTLRTAGYGLMWVLLFLLPAALVQPAERFTYLPSVGFALFVGAILAPFVSANLSISRPRLLELAWWLRVVAVGAVAIIYLATTSGRVQAWVKAGDTAYNVLQNTQAVITKSNLPHYSYLYGENVPADAPGAYLFRTGYGEAIQWLYRDTTVTAFKVVKFPIIEDHLGQSIFLEYKGDGNIVNHLQVGAALQERARNLKGQKPFQSWDFSTTNPQDKGLLAGWYEADGVAQAEIRDGALIPHAPTETLLRNNNLAIPAFQLGAIEITLKATAQPNTPLVARAIWLTNAAANGTSQILQTDPATFQVIADGNYHTYRITPQTLPRNQNGQLTANVSIEDEIVTVTLEFPAGLSNLQIQKITQFQIPNSHTLPLN